MAAPEIATRICFEAIGTTWEIDIRDECAPAKLTDITRKVKDRIAVFDQTYSRFRDDATLMRLARGTGRVRLPEDAEVLLEFYEKLYRVTGGKVTPLVGDVLVQAGYDASYSLKPKGPLVPAAKWEDVISFDAPYISNKQKLVLDVGAAGKGYLVDIVCELLWKEGVREFLVDAGGDIRHHGNSEERVRVGLEHPTDPSLAIGVVELGLESICGSAGNRRKWGNLHHIIDPVSAEPAREVLAAWAVADTAMTADGLATALFFTPASTLKQHFSFEYLLIRPDLSIEYSKGLKAEIFGAGHE